MKGKALRKNSLHEKTAASVLLKLFISSNEWCHTTDDTSFGANWKLLRRKATERYDLSSVDGKLPVLSAVTLIPCCTSTPADITARNILYYRIDGMLEMTSNNLTNALFSYWQNAWKDVLYAEKNDVMWTFLYAHSLQIQKQASFVTGLNDVVCNDLM